MSPEASIVVISHEMGRELPRTLKSLSFPYQRNCPPGRTEVIVVDNGSRRPPAAEDFADLQLDLSVFHLPDAPPSPVQALNFGLARARAPLVCAWIDGARLASPGLVDACIAASRLHPRPVIATANYQLGPGPQNLTMTEGYDAAEEDRLLKSTAWPEDGYRLFEIATPIWFGGPDGAIAESNALFLPLALWDELGGFESRFASPGGGACNPDVFLRACHAPGTQLIRIRGEGTFHQIHGGVATNAAGRMFDVLKTISIEYHRIRGRPMIPIRERGWVYDGQEGGLV